MLRHMQAGLTALMRASRQGHREVVNMLLEHDAQVDLKNNVRTNQFCKFEDFTRDAVMFVVQNGQTALMLASENRHVAVIDLLIEYNAQLELKNLVRTLEVGFPMTTLC